jgi:putative hydrolase of the HAD superfamily
VPDLRRRAGSAVSDTGAEVPLRAVVFDFYGTIAWRGEAGTSPYATAFARHGYRLDETVEADYFATYDGIEHAEHSTSEAAYEAWVRYRLAGLAQTCGVREGDVGPLVDALRTQDVTPVVPYPDAAETLGTLRGRGFRVGVCSNWGWDLDESIEQAGLGPLIDAAVTSARVGARKPHRAIYEAITGALGVTAAETLFVGDSFHPDVTGPLSIGMRAAHVWREPPDSARRPPALPAAAGRVRSVRELLGWPLLATAAAETGGG